jgi:SAM-dependent methyltransferase
MSIISFNNFGFIAKKIGFQNISISSSRYSFQKKYYPGILKGILKKLKINEKDIFLDIGCGLGLFLIPISFFCKESYGIDHKNFISQIKEYFKFFESRKLICGNFLNKKINKKFDKILVFSVLHYMKNSNEFYKFIFKSISLLKKKGKILLGDVPVEEYEISYYNSHEGKEAIKRLEFEKKNLIRQKFFFSISDYLVNRKKDNQLIKINLFLINKLIKKLRYKKYKLQIFRHNKNNIFGNSRVDLLITKK